MLQQTQVSTVVDYYRRWMRRFPDLERLASAREEEVLELWAGLGYYSRGRNLLEAARRIQSEHGGRFPRTRGELLALKGIGEYTAGAILSLAFDKPEPILDGNLVRIFSRFHGLAFLPRDVKGRMAYWEHARAWAMSGAPGDVNEALMELGALVCQPRNPACHACPLASGCAANLEGRQHELPPPRPRAREKRMRGYALVVESEGMILLYRPAKPELLAGLLTFPCLYVQSREEIRPAFARLFPGVIQPEFHFPGARVRHAITHHRIELEICRARLPGRTGGVPAACMWAGAEGVDSLLVSSLPRKIWKLFRNAIDGGAGQENVVPASDAMLRRR